MSDKKPKVLIVDDEEVVCDLLTRELGERGWACTTAFEAGDALIQLDSQRYNVALVDIRLPGTSGMELLREIRQNQPDTAVIMITAIDEVNTAVEAMKLGASDYIVKPFSLERVSGSLLLALEMATEQSKWWDTKDCYKEMNAIADGVMAKYDLLLGYSGLITREVSEVARELEIDETLVQRWVDARFRGVLERRERIQSAIHKLKSSAFT